MSVPSTERLQQQAADWFAQLRSSTDAETQAAFARWQAADPAHAAAYAQVEALWSDPDLTAALFASSATASQRHRHGVLRRMAAAAVLLVGIGATLHFSGADLALTADHVAGAGLPQRVALNDGSVLLLDAGAAVDIDYSTGARRITLRRGRVLADVQPDTTRPFTVTTARGVTAQALGTVYSVAQHDSGTAVAVRDGEVLVSPAQRPGTVLQAGQGVVVGAAGITPLTAGGDPFAWSEGRLVFHDRPLGEVMTELSRYWPGLIWVRGDDLAGLHVSGSYRLDDPPAVVAALAVATGARLSGYAGRLLIVSR